MKNQSFSIQLLMDAMLCMLLLTSCGPQTDRDYLTEVLDNMSTVKAVSYQRTLTSWEPGNTKPVMVSHSRVYEHINPTDTAIGSSYVVFTGDDFTDPYYVYDGKEASYIDKQKEEIRLDDFTQKRPLPFRMVMPELFYQTQTIIQYALTTRDSIELKLLDAGKDYIMELTIHMPNQVEFFGKARYMPSNPYIKDPTSKYKIWIAKENDLPYRLRREMEHNTTEKTGSHFIYNPTDGKAIVAADFYPAGYTIHRRGAFSSKKKIDITGHKAKEWTLTDVHQQKVSLNQIDSKVILLQLTGIGCGPCKISIPYLNRLRSSYSENDLAVIAIETWGRSTDACKAYINHNDIRYQFLQGEKKQIETLLQNYQAMDGVPCFFVIGPDRRIKKICHGYAEEKTDQLLNAAIAAELKK